MQIRLVINSAILLPDPGVYSHFSSFLIDKQIKYSSASLRELGTVRSEACLASVGKVYARVGTPKVGAVVATGRDPLDCSLLLDFRKKTRIDTLAV